MGTVEDPGTEHLTFPWRLLLSSLLSGAPLLQRKPDRCGGGPPPGGNLLQKTRLCPTRGSPSHTEVAWFPALLLAG